MDNKEQLFSFSCHWASLGHTGGLSTGLQEIHACSNPSPNQVTTLLQHEVFILPCDKSNLKKILKMRISKTGNITVLWLY